VGVVITASYKHFSG